MEIDSKATLLQEDDILEKKDSEIRKKIDALSSVQEKLRLVLDIMNHNLKDVSHFNFKEFFDAKHIALDLFKENIPADDRFHLWKHYVDLNAEGRRVKHIIDEQTSFALEQIDLAIAAMEKDIKQMKEKLEQIKNIDFSYSFSISQKHKDLYSNVYKQLSLLNAYAARINSFRKELIKISARNKDKNAFFKRLSVLGDAVFPKRKELIKEMSEEFLIDIEAFKEKYFSPKEKGKMPYYRLRAEIKFLQDLAKKLTINTKAFSQTRNWLSECWDLLREWEQERKKKMEKISEETKESKTKVEEKIKELAAEISQMTLSNAKKKASEIYSFSKRLFVHKQTLKSVKYKLDEILKPFIKKEEEKRNKERKSKAEEKNKQQEKIRLIKDKLTSLLSEENVGTITQELSNVKQMLSKISLSEGDKLIIDHLITEVDETVTAHREEALLSSNPEKEQIKKILADKQKRRTHIKQELEEMRKDLGKSGFDFEKAMALRDIVNKEKDRLEQIEKDIDNLKDSLED